MTFLTGTKTYLSGAIESDNSLINWRLPVKKVLVERFGLDLHDPHANEKQNKGIELIEAKQRGDYAKVAEIVKSFVRRDLSEVDESRIVIVRARHDIPSVGTWHETFNAWDNKKLVLLVNEDGLGKIPSWLFGFIDWDRYMFPSWEKMYSYLDEINNGIHKEDFRLSRIYGLV